VARIIVVGAGVSGLAAAARLAARGHQVTVCESSSHAGGALAGWRHEENGEALVFDIGACTLTLPAAFRDLFIKTARRSKGAAITLEEVIGLESLDPVRRYVFSDGTRLDLPNASRARLTQAFDDALGPGAGAAWLRVIDHGSRVWNTIRPALVEAPGSGRRELAHLLRSRSGRAALTPGRSLDDLTRRWFSNHPRLGLLLDDYARRAGADPRHAPAVLAMHPYIEHAFGAWRIPAGAHTLAIALHTRAAERGVEFRFNAPVARIETASPGAANGVSLADGARMPADIVIAAVDTATLAKLTGVPKPRLAYPPDATALCLAVDPASAVPMPHETVLLDDSGPAIHIHVAAQHPLAWTIHAEGNQDTDTLLGRLARRGLDVRGKVVARHVTTGAAYGPAPRDLRSTLLRSAVAQPVRGLYHVGASARPGAGLAFAALSAWHASELIEAGA
jgi:phytoene dehydrogenase-like protein